MSHNNSERERQGGGAEREMKDFHPAIGTWHLYDGLLLHKEKVTIFAKTLEDTAQRPSKSSSSPSPPEDHPLC